MKLHEFGVGRITAQNTTKDVKPGETERQAKKLGLGGKPKLLHKTAAKNSNPNTLMNLGIGESTVNEEPTMLYHATYRSFLDSIMKNGLGGSGAQTQWEDSKPGYVYLAKDPEVAVSHAEANEEVPDEYIDNIVVLSIDASQLDQDRLEDDPNVQDDDSTLAYKGIIPTSAFSVMESLQELKIEKPDPKDTLGIERKFMPQIKSEDYEEFIEFLTQNGVKFRQEKIPASELRAMQKQFSDKGILKQLEKNIAQGPNTKAVIASSDDYILDGHHRWLVAVNTGTDLNVYRVNMPAWRLYDLVNQFEKVYYKDIYDEGKPTIGVPLSSGLVVSIFPHRPLKIKPSTPGKLRYDEDNSSIGSQINFPGFKKDEKPKTKPKYNPVPKKDQSVLDKIKGFFEGEGINEAYMLRLENTDDQLVLHVKNTKTGERMEVRGKPNYEIDYDPNDELHQLLDVIGKASNISELMNGEIVNVNPKHPDGPRSYKALHDLMHEDLYNWFKEKWGVEEGSEITMWTNPEYQGSDVDDEYYNKQPAKLIDVNKLTPFEPADKMDDEISAANMNKLVKAIQAGQKINPIVVVPHKGKLLIIDGHHRYFASLKAGVDKIRVVFADPKDLTWRDDIPIDEAPTARDSMNLDADKLQQSIDYFYTTHAPKNFGTARNEGNFKGLKVVTFTKGQDTLMFLVNNQDQAVFYVMYSKFDDGAAIGNVRSNGTVKATEVYAYLVDKFGTLYSDDSQTPQGRKIWTSLANFYPNLDVKDTGGRFVATKKTQVDEGVNDPHIFKAVFLAGGPGSGKSFVAQALLGGTGLKTMNSDDVYEILMKKQDLALDPDTIASPQGQEIRDKAKYITKRRSVNWIDGRLGLLIDGTGKDVAKYQKQAEFLRMLGYDVAMIYVNTSEEVAQQRNQQRARSLPRDMVSTMWNEVQQNLMKFQQLMGAGRFYIIDNSGGLEDLDRQKNFDKAYNELQRFLNTPPSKRAALAWIQQQKEQSDEKRSAIQQQNQQSDGGTSATN